MIIGNKQEGFFEEASVADRATCNWQNSLTLLQSRSVEACDPLLCLRYYAFQVGVCVWGGGAPPGPRDSTQLWLAWSPDMSLGMG